MKAVPKLLASLAAAAALATAVCLGLAQCKRDDGTGAIDGADVSGEKSPDGKQMVRGCIWYYASASSSDGGGTKDVLAFCDDGRVCVQSDGSGAWRCVQFGR